MMHKLPSRTGGLVIRLRAYKKIAGALVGLIILGSVAVVVTPSASATTSVCGAGYSLVGVVPVNAGNTRIAELDVYWSGAAGKNCAVLQKLGTLRGHASSTSVSITTNTAYRPYLNGPFTGVITDSGNFSYYAGPVYLSARSQCISVGASVVGVAGYRHYAFKHGWCG